jgi:hypothetical protein
MSTEGIKPLASLDGAMLGRRGLARRVPLSFAPIEDIVSDDSVATELPEVVQQVARLARALGIDVPDDEVADLPIDGADTARRRVAFTLRLDAVRHARLRAIAGDEGRSAQQVLIEALDLYRAGTAGPTASPATESSHRKAPTGNQP